MIEPRSWRHESYDWTHRPARDEADYLRSLAEDRIAETADCWPSDVQRVRLAMERARLQKAKRA